MRRLSLVLAAAAALGIAACSDKKQPPVAAAPSVADSADQILVTTHYLLTNDGIKRGDLTADTAFILGQGTRFDLRKAHVVFTTETGAPQGTMDGNRGTYNTQMQVMEGWGNVIVRTPDGRTLKTPHATYNQILHTIVSDTNYTITRGNDTQSGIGFTYNQTTGSFKCLKACGGNFSVALPAK
ncbi:MAG TPA: LPS export ABC transporter periplasmic protein LptC [Gemmatimonadaceae bacterium]|jgi:LPS export ABC transporter protein LptC